MGKTEAIRAALAVAGFAGWYATQAVLGRRGDAGRGVGDALHALTAPLNRALHARPRLANFVLAALGLILDGFVVGVVAWGIFGASTEPGMGLLVVLLVRQVCQALCRLPVPEGILFRHPGFPSLIVSYGVLDDFFFSGHVAGTAYAALELARLGGPWPILGAAAVAIEAAGVIVLRAHYTMDVVAALLCAWFAASVSHGFAPVLDGWIRTLAG